MEEDECVSDTETEVQAVPDIDTNVNVAPEVVHSEYADEDRPLVFDVKGLAVHYGSFRAVRDVELQICKHEVTAFIGPSGCGKTTVLRCFNRMNDLIDGARVDGTITYRGVDLYDPRVNPVEVRRRI